MICAGDELGHSQKGNNNTYCHDSELTWLDWTLDEEGRDFLAFVRRVIALRRSQPVFQRRSFFQGRGIRGADVKDISWLSPSGREMNDEAWTSGSLRCLGVRLAGDRIGELNERGEHIVGDTLLILLNAHHEPVPFTLPAHLPGQRWECLLDTALPASEPAALSETRPYTLAGRSLAVLRVRQNAEEKVTEAARPAATTSRSVPL
jgi:glycogen operon protein